MHIITVKTFNAILDNYESGIADPRQVELTFQLHRDGAKFYLDNRDAVPTPEHYKEAGEHISETTGVIVSADDTAAILSLFPSARIKLAVYNGCGDEVRDLIYDAACAFFGGFESPTYGDKVDIDRFILHLQSQAKKMGYRVMEGVVAN